MRANNLIVLLVLLFVSCGKPEEERTEESFDNHPTWTDSNPGAFWDKQQEEGLLLDSTWWGDTTIIFLTR